MHHERRGRHAAVLSQEGPIVALQPQVQQVWVGLERKKE